MITKQSYLQKTFKCFINFYHEEEKNYASYINHEEINQVLKFLNSLIENSVNTYQIGAISAYCVRTHLISENLRWYNL